MAQDLVIDTAGVCKAYGDVQALAGLDLRVPRGAICGLLGRNGAGKTTTLKVLLGMVRPTSGQARVLGLAADDARSSVAIRARTAFVSEDKDLYEAFNSELKNFIGTPEHIALVTPLGFGKDYLPNKTMEQLCKGE